MKTKKDENDTLIQDEERQGGVINFSTWLSYFRAPGSYVPFLCMLLSFGLEASALGVSQWWLSVWSNNTGIYTVEVFLGVYAALSIGSSFGSLLRSLVQVVFSISAGRQMHQKVLERVLRYPQSFFDTCV